ncbi:uncharacterized protein LOC142976989 [Anticarsia gemmatalis]|uniref:uncharacterized protein LOC142976989 n=1 Tax=Anticarsia gemmatalis TaxID=129554 RepID=UPI003F76C53F
MRLYASLLLAACALAAARAATLPDTVVPVDVVPADIVPDVVPQDKAPENAASEQELIDQANTINDVDNTLRVKPADIPVQVVVDNAEQALKASNAAEDIVRPPVDLRNPGPPQRQEHETQNPEFYAAEQQLVLNYKNNINNAEAVLRQGFQGVSENIQDMWHSSEYFKKILGSIENLSDSFTAEMNRLNGTIQRYLKPVSQPDSDNVVNPVKEETKANFENVESGLNALKNDFTKGVNTLSDGVFAIAALKAESENPPASTGTTPAQASNNQPFGILMDYVAQMQSNMQSGLRNISQSLNNYVTQAQSQGWFFGQQSSTAAPAASNPAGTQADTQAPAPAPPANNWFNLPNPFAGLLNGNQNNQQVNGPFQQAIQNFQNFQNWFQPNRPEAQIPAGATSQPPAQSTASSNNEQTTSKTPQTDGDKEQPASAQPNQAAAVTPLGPIRQILQNNPITQGIAGAVQRLQNINNPEKPREPQVVKPAEKPQTVEEKPKGHPPAVGDNNISDSRVDDKETVKEVQKESIPEVPEPQKEVSEKKADEVVDKTE